MYKFFSDAVSYLNSNGMLCLVINKKHGAESALRFLKTIYKSVEVLGKNKGFYVIKCNIN